MAGDWIKIRKSLTRDPRVVRISSALNADRLRTIGGLVSAWCLLDEQTEDGKLEGYTPEIFDEIVGVPGIAAAMASVNWLELGEGFLAAPRFEEHNGHSAKRRAQENVRKLSARNADKCPQREQTKSALEKRREEKSNTPLPPEGAMTPFLESIWNAGPIATRHRSSKKQLATAWARTTKKPDEAEVLRILALWAKSYDWTKQNGEYAPGIHRWVQCRQWENDPTANSDSTPRTRDW